MSARYLEAAARLLVIGGLAIAAVVTPGPAQGTAPASAAAPRELAPAPAGADVAMDAHGHDVDVVE